VRPASHHRSSVAPCPLLPSAAGALKLVHDCVMMLSPFILEQLLKELQSGGSRACLRIPAAFSPAAAVLCACAPWFACRMGME